MAGQTFNLERDNTGAPLPIVRLGTATPISNSAGVAATSAESLGGYRLFRVTATENVWLQFGTASVTATADGDANVLFLAGTEILIIPEAATHWSGIRAGATDSVVQFFPVNEI